MYGGAIRATGHSNSGSHWLRLACGILDNGFATFRCRACRAEYLVAFSCNSRGLCPSCAAKRAAALAACLRDEVLADVGHAQWAFSIPKMLRPYFMYRSRLLGRLCRPAYCKPGFQAPTATAPADRRDFLARFVMHVPDPHRHVIRDGGRVLRRAQGAAPTRGGNC